LSGENSVPKYGNFLCFVVSVQTNKLMGRRGGIGYSKLQMETHNIIKSLHVNVMGYRKIANYLNSKNIKTHTGKQWKGNHLHATLERFKEREKRLFQMDEVFKPEISKFEVRWERIGII